MTPSCTFNTTVNGINNNTIIPSTIGLWPNKLNIAEPKTILKHDTNLEIIACSECTFVCLIHNTTNMALEA